MIFFQFLSCTGVFQYTDTCTTHVQHMCNISSTGCTKTISNKHHCTWVVQYINACATHVQHMCKILLLTVIQQHFHLLYAHVQFSTLTHVQTHLATLSHRTRFSVKLTDCHFIQSNNNFNFCTGVFQYVSTCATHVQKYCC